MVTSIGLANVMWVLLLANWLFEGRWSEKWQMTRQSRLLQAVVALFLLHVVGLLWCSNLPAGFHVVERELPLLVVPLVVLTTRPPQGRVRQTILGIYVATVFVVTIIGLIRWITIPDLPYRDIIPFISHIRFALNVCLAIFLVVFSVQRSVFTKHITQSTLLFLLLLWFLFFLFLLRSYTAFIVLIVASLVVIFHLRRKWLWLTLWLAVMGVMCTMVTLGIREYYRIFRER